MIDRRLIRDFDWGLLSATIILAFIGVMTIYSSTRPLFDLQHESYYLKQLNWIVLSLICFSFVLMIDYRWYVRFAYFFYIIGIILLVFVLIAGRTGMGAKRWINLGFFSFQPSEFFKIFFIMTLARYLSGFNQDSELGLRELMKITAGLFLLPSILILRQPDLGTMLILLFVFAAMMLTAGVRRKIIVTALVVGVVISPLAGKIFWGGLKDYQKNRIIAFIDPQADPRGIGYHITQSKVSIGSGGFTGKGYLKGTQGPYRFLPENHTDFIFSIFAEEWGFFGSVVLFGIYLFIIWRGFETARSARDPEGRLLAIGVTYMFTFYFVINTGMTLGLLPVVGVPLPLVSYGGTALLSNFLALSMIENVRMRRFASYYG